MNKVDVRFSIKDLENLSGVKIPTIRMWEKRYDVLKPYRTDTNIRYYDSNQLTKLLNIVYLNKNGYKISKIADMSPTQMLTTVKEIYEKNMDVDVVINELLLSAFSYDKALFHKTYASLVQRYAFREIFFKFFIPLLDRVGFLWQMGSINPMQEHFMSNLVLQKIYSNIDIASSLNKPDPNDDRLFVLYLPENEIHGMGLLFVYYDFLQKNRNVIYLGENVAIDSLKDMLSQGMKITFVSYFTIYPAVEELEEYFEQMDALLLMGNNQFWVTGYKLKGLKKRPTNPKIMVFDVVNDLLEV